MVIKKHLLFALLSITLMMQFVTACSPSTPTAQNLEGENWIIFHAEQAKELRIADIFLSSSQTAEYWTPSEQDIVSLEGRLASYLQQNPDRFSTQEAPAWERLDEYNRQYTGVILDGKRIIYANYFCDSTGMDWKKDFVFVADGGDCYFQFKYDTETEEFFDLQVNGEA